jgi:hypothetical protein
MHITARAQTPVNTLMAHDRAADESARRTTRASYMALGWVVLFFAFHVNWYLGGSFASPGGFPGAPHSPLAWIFELFVAGAFPLGAFVCLVIVRGCARGRLTLPAAGLVWFGCVQLRAPRSSLPRAASRRGRSVPGRRWRGCPRGARIGMPRRDLDIAQIASSIAVDRRSSMPPAQRVGRSQANTAGELRRAGVLCGW